jgi:hypothetical protein
LYVLEKSDVTISQNKWSGFWPMQGAEIYFAEPSLAKLEGLVSKTGGSRISRNSNDLGEITTIELDDWRIPLVHYLEDSNHIADRKVRWQALKYVVLNNNLYH